MLALLQAGRPVAVSLPEYMHPTLGPAVTNWRLPAARLRGEVPNPPPRRPRAPTGHAVCILGFQPAEDEPMGGWFIFRNSLGLRFAEDAPDLSRRRPDGTPRAPVVPDNGYGAISASHVENHVWEVFAPPPLA